MVGKNRFNIGLVPTSDIYSGKVAGAPGCRAADRPAAFSHDRQPRGQARGSIRQAICFLGR